MNRRVAKYGKLGPVYEIIPRPVYRLARAAWLDLRSVPRRLSGRNPGPEPWLIFHNFGGNDFYQSGSAACSNIQSKLGFGPVANILDIGCGSGRIAWPLRNALNEEGRYIGFDVSAKAIAFARQLLQGHDDRFSFHHADLFSEEYNPQSTVKASDYTFPCDDGWADAAIATSVFTHLLEDDARQYLAELARCLKPDGSAYLTAYLVNDAARANMAAKTATLTMQPYGGPVWAGDLAVPEAMTGYDEDAFLSMLAEAGLKADGDIFHGAWSQGDGAAYSQDVMVVRRQQ